MTIALMRNRIRTSYKYFIFCPSAAADIYLSVIGKFTGPDIFC
ncbi:unnamed protein product [marine sediment metagenome]|uniref:Uncharacterized protein n=1 Tax=marine sediment metagenome TaxID=412755 RepID=X1KML5_9ZZZZ